MKWFATTACRLQDIFILFSNLCNEHPINGVQLLIAIRGSSFSQWTAFMPNGLPLICGFAFALTALTSGATCAQTPDSLHDFKLGSSFADAQRNASEKGWRLKELSPALPGQWAVEGSNLGLFVCGDKIASIQQHLDGGVDDFALIVQGFKGKYGEPATTIVTFPFGAAWISNIDARFASPSGESVAVQLNSTAGKLGIDLNFFNANMNCTTEAKP